MNEIGSTIRQARIAAGMTQEQLARQAGISPPYMSQIEKGKIPSFAVCERLGQALPQALDLCWLLNEITKINCPRLALIGSWHLANAEDVPRDPIFARLERELDTLPAEDAAILIAGFQRDVYVAQLLYGSRQQHP